MAGRPSTQSDSLESTKGFIIMLIREQACTVNEIREHLATEWEVELSEVPSTASINRKLKAWGARICDLLPEEHKEALRKHHEDYTVYDDDELIDEVRRLRSRGQRTDEMVVGLRSSKWPELSFDQLKRLRHREKIF